MLIVVQTKITKGIPPSAYRRNKIINKIPKETTYLLPDKIF